MSSRLFDAAVGGGRLRDKSLFLYFFQWDERTAKYHATEYKLAFAGFPQSSVMYNYLLLFVRGTLRNYYTTNPGLRTRNRILTIVFVVAFGYQQSAFQWRRSFRVSPPGWTYVFFLLLFLIVALLLCTASLHGQYVARKKRCIRHTHPVHQEGRAGGKNATNIECKCILDKIVWCVYLDIHSLSSGCRRRQSVVMIASGLFVLLSLFSL